MKIASFLSVPKAHNFRGSKTRLTERWERKFSWTPQKGMWTSISSQATGIFRCYWKGKVQIIRILVLSRRNCVSRTSRSNITKKVHGNHAKMKTRDKKNLHNNRELFKDQFANTFRGKIFERHCSISRFLIRL